MVRTNVYEPNESNTINNQQFCVITEVIRRSSNISLEPQHNSFNNVSNTNMIFIIIIGVIMFGFILLLPSISDLLG